MPVKEARAGSSTSRGDPARHPPHRPGAASATAASTSTPPRARLGGGRRPVRGASSSDDRLSSRWASLGEGIPAALFMAVTVTLLDRCLASSGGGRHPPRRERGAGLAQPRAASSDALLRRRRPQATRAVDRELRASSSGAPERRLFPEFVFPATGTVAGAIPGIEILSQTVPLVRARRMSSTPTA